ncbi:MAG: tetratricopeptide repeat protein [Thermostichus sp. BF3_bins_97]
MPSFPQKAPLDLERRFAECVAHWQQGQISQAAQLAQEILTVEPNHLGSLQILGMIAHQQGQPQEALAYLQKVVTLQPAEADAHYNLAFLLHSQGSLAEAVPHYRQALLLDPDHLEARVNFAQLLRSAQLYREAVQEYQEVVRLQPRSAQAHNDLGILLKEMGSLPEAIQAYEQAIQLQPDYAEAHNNLANALKAKGDGAAAEGAYRRALQLKPNLAEAHNNLGTLYEEQGQLEKAVQCYQQAILARSGYAEALSNLGDAFGQLGQLEQGLHCCQRAVLVDPYCLEGQLNLANLLLMKGDPQAAEAACQRALELHPAHPLALALQTIAQAEQQHWTEALHLADPRTFVQTFPSPQPEETARLNPRLAEMILAHPSLIWERTRNATRSGYHSGNLLADCGTESLLNPADPDHPLYHLGSRIATTVPFYLEQLLPQLPPDHPWRERIQGPFQVRDLWAVVMQSQGHQIPHVHPSASLSGVYYVQVPASLGVDAADPSGWLEFGTYPERFPFAQQPTHPLVQKIQPQPGLLVLFPSHLWHRTIPFVGTEPRISIAFDIVFTGP